MAAACELTQGVCDRGMFGGTASEERIREEMLGYSDYQIHRFCLGSGSKRIAKRQLPPDAVRLALISTLTRSC